MQSLSYYYHHPNAAGLRLLARFGQWLPDKAFLKLKFRLAMGKKLDLERPQTFSEKLQWIKLYDHNPLYTTLVDKYQVKAYVAEHVGNSHVIPLLGVWDKVEEIDWESLPNQFVIKCSHDCGGMVICKDKTKLDIKEAALKLKKAFKKNYYYAGREWPYKNVPKKVFAEAYMEDEFGELRDYKWFCFDGEPKAFFIAQGRQKDTETTFDFFDMDFNHLPFTNGHPNCTMRLEKPKGFDEMKQLASVLSKGIPEVRVDFYSVNGKIYFGEFTFFHWGGMTPFVPEEWDYTFGSWIRLPEKQI